MDDLISRQAAIDAVLHHGEIENHYTDLYYDGYCDGVYDSADILKDMPSAQPEIIRCKDCKYYDPPHVENNGERIEYSEMPKDAFDVLGVGLVSAEYGINIGGRCLRDYNVGYSEDKRVFVPETNYCGRAERRADE